jgi:DNA-binding MarR family transcriptional regulator
MAEAAHDVGMRAWRAFLEAHAGVVRRLEHELRDEQGFPISWYDALVQLHEAGGTLRMHELAERLLLSRSATTRFADRLEREGLVERRQSPHDRRGMELRLTDRGEERLRRAAPVHLRGVASHFIDKLTPDEAETLYVLMRKIASTG